MTLTTLPNQSAADRERVESLYEKFYNRVHLYVGGQLYIISVDLDQYITQEAILNHCSYCEGVEDHEIASIGFRAISNRRSNGDDMNIATKNIPLIKLVMVGYHQQFWQHPIKTNNEWEAVWQREK